MTATGPLRAHLAGFDLHTAVPAGDAPARPGARRIDPSSGCSMIGARVYRSVSSAR